MRLPEAHTTQTAAGQCQAKLYIYMYISLIRASLHLSLRWYLCRSIHLPFHLITLRHCSIEYTFIYALNRWYWLCVCFDWVTLRLRLGNFGHGQVANDATENDNRHECAATMTAKRNETNWNRNGTVLKLGTPLKIATNKSFIFKVISQCTRHAQTHTRTHTEQRSAERGDNLLRYQSIRSMRQYSEYSSSK